jgi:hypothetical protein
MESIDRLFSSTDHKVQGVWASSGDALHQKNFPCCSITCRINKRCRRWQYVADDIKMNAAVTTEGRA